MKYLQMPPSSNSNIRIHTFGLNKFEQMLSEEYCKKNKTAFFKLYSDKTFTKDEEKEIVDLANAGYNLKPVLVFYTGDDFIIYSNTLNVLLKHKLEISTNFHIEMISFDKIDKSMANDIINLNYKY